MNLPRPRRIALLVALVATLVLLCCGGSVSAILLGGFGDNEDNHLNAALGCGKGGPIDPDSKLPRVRPYGPTQVRNAAIIINTAARLGHRGRHGHAGVETDQSGQPGRQQ